LLVAKVSQRVGSPVSKPVENHLRRCADEPWVNDPWSTLPLPRLVWMKSSPMRPAASSARSMSSWVISTISGCP
jgi:hypothetical protein